jgi:hypothetical protein
MVLHVPQCHLVQLSASAEAVMVCYMLTQFGSGSSRGQARPSHIPSFSGHCRRQPWARQLPLLLCTAKHRRREECGRQQRENEASLMADIYFLLRPGRQWDLRRKKPKQPFSGWRRGGGIKDVPASPLGGLEGLRLLVFLWTVQVAA